MTSGERDGRSAAEKIPPTGRGGVPPAVVTLIGVLALLIIALANRQSVARLDRSLGERLGRLETRIHDVVGTAVRLPAGPGSSSPRPDPARVYPIDTEGAPSRGKADAAVTIAEFADFQ